MSNVEHLFENAIVALEHDYHFGEWKRIEKDRYNTDGVSEEVLEAIWELAIYTKYTYEPSLNTIPIEWIEDYIKKHTFTFRIYDTTNENDLEAITTNELTLVSKMLDDWEKENATEVND